MVCICCQEVCKLPIKTAARGYVTGSLVAEETAEVGIEGLMKLVI